MPVRFYPLFAHSGEKGIMTIHVGDGLTASDFLQLLCRFDPAAWCFVPIDERQITCCSSAFLELWAWPPDRIPTAESGISLSDGELPVALTKLGLPSDFFLRLLEAGQNPQGAPQTMVRHDGKRLTVHSSPTFTGDGLPCGRLIWFQVASGPEISSPVLNSMEHARECLARLSAREREVVHLHYDGKTNKAIALITGISEKTVEKHRARIMEKVNVNSSAELIRLVCYANLVSDFHRSDSDSARTAES